MDLPGAVEHAATPEHPRNPAGSDDSHRPVRSHNGNHPIPNNDSSRASSWRFVWKFGSRHIHIAGIPTFLVGESVPGYDESKVVCSFGVVPGPMRTSLPRQEPAPESRSSLPGTVPHWRCIASKNLRVVANVESPSAAERSASCQNRRSLCRPDCAAFARRYCVPKGISLCV